MASSMSFITTPQPSKSWSVCGGHTGRKGADSALFRVRKVKNEVKPGDSEDISDVAIEILEGQFVIGLPKALLGSKKAPEPGAGNIVEVLEIDNARGLELGQHFLCRLDLCRIESAREPYGSVFIL